MGLGGAFYVGVGSFPRKKRAEKRSPAHTPAASFGAGRGPSSNMSEQLNQSQSLDSASSKLTKRKNSSLIDLIFGPKRKRSRTTGVDASVDCKMAKDNTKEDGASAKKTKPSLEKSRKKEVKARLNDEASKEIRSLAVGTLAMMASALANQGR